MVENESWRFVDDSYVRKMLYRIYGPYQNFFITHEDAMKTKCPAVEHGHMLNELLGMFASREVTGHKAKGMWKHFINKLPNENLQVVAGMILNKDIKARTGVATVNKVLKKYKHDLVPTFKVALGDKWEGEPVWDNDVYYASRKLDGCRCIVVLEKGEEPQLLSRSGIPFDNFEELRNVFRGLEWNCVLDGELGLITKDGRDDFKGLIPNRNIIIIIFK